MSFFVKIQIPEEADRQIWFGPFPDAPAAQAVADNATAHGATVIETREADEQPDLNPMIARITKGDGVYCVYADGTEELES